MKETTDDQRPTLWLYTPDTDFVRPYFERMMAEYRITDSATDAQEAVMISSTDIYGLAEGSGVNELAPIAADSHAAAGERYFADECSKAGMEKFAVLRCVPIVGTGMTGVMRMLAERVYRGTFIAICGNEARRSVVHAVSLPDAARAALKKGGTYNVCDCVDPELNEIADALAWRISQKRVFSLKAKWVKLLFGKKNFINATRTLTFSAEKLHSTGQFEPVSTVEYLKTHVYDDESL